MSQVSNCLCARIHGTPLYTVTYATNLKSGESELVLLCPGSLLLAKAIGNCALAA